MFRSLGLTAILASLPSLLHASPWNNFPSFKDAEQCAKAITQLSCHSSYYVDPNSFGTCCYNGALAPGDKESGSILSTQFWNVSTGPADSFTIHGLWPDYCDGTYPQFCSAQSGIPNQTGEQIEEIIGQYDPALLDYMRIYYENEPSFWEHEQNKHMTCYSTLRAKCQLDFSPYINQTSAAVLGYFQQIVHEFKHLPTYKWLKEAGITPSATKNYTLTEVQNALTVRHGGVPYVGCYDGQLSEVWYFFNVRGPLIHGQYVAANSTATSSCPASFNYPPKPSSN